jgi:hypothetical protein
MHVLLTIIDQFWHSDTTHYLSRLAISIQLFALFVLRTTPNKTNILGKKL